jgi:hypothetical protein
MIAGYAHPDYARAFSEYGTPLELPRCGGWILERTIPGFAATDAMGCYPLFVCQDWSQLRDDLAHVRSRLVSLVLVADPFGDHTPEQLNACFDLVKPFKQHVIVDLSRPRDEVVAAHHRKMARRALRRLSVERCETPLLYLDAWVELYGYLVETHGIKGIPAFSRESFYRQFQVPGGSLFTATYEGKLVGAAFSYQQGDVVYAHLTSFNEIGYDLSASYGLKWIQLDYYSDKARWLDLGGVPGTDGNGDRGLGQFKRGWSPETKTVYLCGGIFDPEKYAAIVDKRGAAHDGYFPAYRTGEFTDRGINRIKFCHGLG